MNWSNYHCHSNYCDGKGVLEDYIKEVLMQGIKSFGFSSHAPVPFELVWAMSQRKLSNYINEIDELKEKYKKNIQIYTGLEVDYIPGTMEPMHQDIVELSLDYTVGSVHFVGQFQDGTYFEVDKSRQVFVKAIDQLFSGNVRSLIQRYFELVRKMLTESKPTILGHLDKIKIHNTAGMLFDANANWYMDEMRHTLEVLATSGTILEVNTRGLYKKKSNETYPSKWVLGEALKKDIPVTINSDAHHPKEITSNFKSAASILREIGYRSTYQLWDGEWKKSYLKPV